VNTYSSDNWNNGLTSSDFSNTSRGAGARALKDNPYTTDNYTTQSYTPSAGAAVIESDSDTTQGAGARNLTGETAAPTTPDNGQVVTTTRDSATFDTSAPNTQGDAARNLTETSESSDTALPNDAQFVREAGSAGLAEVRMGQLAEQNSQNQALKDFGQRLVADHTKANQQLTQIASEKGLQAPTSMSSSDQKMIDRLSSATGAEFDRSCKRHAIEAHEKAIRLFKSAAKSKDPQISTFAQQTLPTLEEHLRMARELPKD